MSQPLPSSQPQTWHLNRALSMDKVDEVKDLLRDGISIREVARKTDCAETDIQCMAGYLAETRGEVSV